MIQNGYLFPIQRIEFLFLSCLRIAFEHENELGPSFWSIQPFELDPSFCHTFEELS